MPKTEMTLAIEKAIRSYRPAELSGIKVNKHRYEHTALEVPVACGTNLAGMIDAVRVSEYFGDMEWRRVCRLNQFRKKDGFRERMECAKGLDTSKAMDLYCEKKSCFWNVRQEVGTQKILITSFEIKVSKSDFKSKHGHNHVCNLNYYAMPKELYPQVQDLIPEGIGVLVYLHEGSYVGLRMKRKSAFVEMSDEDQKWMILSVMKRLRDMESKEYWEHLRQIRENTGSRSCF